MLNVFGLDITLLEMCVIFKFIRYLRIIMYQNSPIF